MDGAAGVQSIVEVERVAHAGVQQGGLRRRKVHSPQQNPALLSPAPTADHRAQLADSRGAAAAEHAAESIENIAAGGFDSGFGEVRVLGAADVLGELPGSVIAHWSLTHVGSSLFDLVLVLHYTGTPWCAAPPR